MKIIKRMSAILLAIMVILLGSQIQTESISAVANQQELPVIKQCATDAYLNNPEKAGIVNSYIKEISRRNPTLINIIHTSIIPKERCLKNSHYVFYHGQSNANRIVVDVLKKIHEQLEPTQYHQDIEYFRSKTDLSQYDTDIHTLLHNFQTTISNNSDSKGDLEEPFRTQLLSVNLSLFGNTANLFDSSSLDYVLDNRNQLDLPYLNLEKIIQSYNISLTNVSLLRKQYNTLLEILNQPGSGCLYQIFIPQNRIDSCVYLSLGLGFPIKNKHLEAYLDKNSTLLKNSNSEAFTKMSWALPLYCNEAGKFLWYNLNMLQARIVLPAMYKIPNVQIYKYDLLSEAQKKQYANALDRFTCELFKGSPKNLSLATA